MIRVVKRAAPPGTLAARGSAAARAHAAEVAAGLLPTFDPTIWGDDAVRVALAADQHGKCCFCEAKIEHSSFPHVEHFRPKAAWRAGVGAPLVAPGYYWLAYDWDNLFLACQVCNSRHEGSLFPLLAGGIRATTPSSVLAAELPAFVEPSEAISKHITFRAEVAVPLTRRGSTTVAALELNRAALRERRRERHEVLSTLLSLVRVGKPGPEAAKARRLLRRLRGPDAEYSAMARRVR